MNKKVRVLCTHSIYPTIHWRGPIRADRSLAEIDKKDHLKTCEVSQDIEIIQEGDAFWDDEKDKQMKV